MNTLVLSLSCAVAVTFLATPLMAQDDESMAAEPASTTEVLEATDQRGTIKETITDTSSKTASKEGKKITTLDLKGEVEAIDVDDRTFIVDGKTFKFWKTGKVFFKRKQKSLSDVKVGDRVAVTYREASDGTLEASRINK